MALVQPRRGEKSREAAGKDDLAARKQAAADAVEQEEGESVKDFKARQKAAVAAVE